MPGASAGSSGPPTSVRAVTLSVGAIAEIEVTASVTATPAAELRAVAVETSPALDPSGSGVGATTVVAS